MERAVEGKKFADIAMALADEAERFALWLRKAVGKANGARSPHEPVR